MVNQVVLSCWSRVSFAEDHRTGGKFCAGIPLCCLYGQGRNQFHRRAVGFSGFIWIVYDCLRWYGTILIEAQKPRKRFVPFCGGRRPMYFGWHQTRVVIMWLYLGLLITWDPPR